ncbi:glutamate--tRNA ligase [candidate division KSB1 bacterium]
MNNHGVRVRFAPSPTGYLHIGGARTAIFNWIFAKSRNGKFLLRIEDTDKARSTLEFHDSIVKALQWLGLTWDEDTYIQSNNIDGHRTAVDRLLENRSAYKCFCLPESLEQKREEALRAKRNPLYDGTCRHLSPEDVAKNEEAGTPYAVRFRVPDGETVFEDLIHGRTAFRHEEIDDFILQRRDATPTYMLAVIHDDHVMNISHVIRGDDHLSNTPKQIMLYHALGWEVPFFGHMPMILGPDKTRLSKRHGAVSVDTYRERGYLPEALCNYLTLLGWSPKEDREKMDMDEVINIFRIEDSLRKSAVFDEQKLIWMNSLYLPELPTDGIAERIHEILKQDMELRSLVEEREKDYLTAVLELTRQRLKLLTDFLRYCAYFYRDPATYDPDAVKKHWKDPDTREHLAHVRLCVLGCNDYSVEGIEADIRTKAEDLDIKAAKLIHPTRLALTGFGVSPGLFEVMQLLGRETVARRLDNAVRFLEGAS